MAGKMVKGAAAGAALGTAVPAVGNVVGAIGGAVVGTLTELFSSKKHYHLYYFDPASGAWRFVLDGHPSQVNPVAKTYTSSGLVVAIVRNKGDKAPDGSLAPKAPPVGYTATGGKATGFNPWVLAGIALAGLLGFVLLKRRK